jgi:hypothetical protein
VRVSVAAWNAVKFTTTGDLGTANITLGPNHSVDEVCCGNQH